MSEERKQNGRKPPAFETSRIWQWLLGRPLVRMSLAPFARSVPGPVRAGRALVGIGSLALLANTLQFAFGLADTSPKFAFFSTERYVFTVWGYASCATVLALGMFLTQRRGWFPIALAAAGLGAMATVFSD